LPPFKSVLRIEIAHSIETITDDCFSDATSRQEVIFTSDSDLRELNGFLHCTSLCRIALPASVEIIKGFDDNPALQEVRFPSDSHLRELKGFLLCASLCRIAFPASVEIIKGFDDSYSLREVRFQHGSQLKVRTAFRGCTFFTVYDDNDFMKNSRRRLHLQTSELNWRGLRGWTCSIEFECELSSIRSEWDSHSLSDNEQDERNECETQEDPGPRRPI
jgi:hypothetical protein